MPATVVCSSVGVKLEFVATCSVCVSDEHDVQVKVTPGPGTVCPLVGEASAGIGTLGVNVPVLDHAEVPFALIARTRQ